MTARRTSITATLATIALTLITPVMAQSAEPIDIATLDQDARDGILGQWIIADQSGTKTCRVSFSDQMAIGGYAIEIDPACAAAFPVMDAVGSWRLYESWEIVLADATRKELIRFTTPDESYVAMPETDGIFTIKRPE